LKIGVISDTHGLLRPQAVSALQGVEHILHAGDIGDLQVLEDLRRIAPVTAIRGNVDTHRDFRLLPETEAVELAGKLLYVIHDVKQLDLVPAVAGFSAVISGHSHKPLIEWNKGVLFFNPGSAGPRRFSLPVSLGFLTIANGQLHASTETLVVS
jgi:putative phosphoesterase